MRMFDVLIAFFHLALFAAVAAVAVSNPGHASEPAAAYSSIAVTADGIGKSYMGREIAKVMTYHGAGWLERNERAHQERPDLIIAALDLRPGMSVADIGAGTGYYAWRMARLIGKSGIVYAVDVQPEMLKLLTREMAKRGAENVKPILGAETDPHLAPNSIDVALMVDVYHEFEYPHEMLAAITQALKSGGRVAFVEFKADDAGVPIKRLHTMSEEQVRKEASVHSLEWMKTVRELPWQHMIVFRKR